MLKQTRMELPRYYARVSAAAFPRLADLAARAWMKVNGSLSGLGSTAARACSRGKAIDGMERRRRDPEVGRGLMSIAGIGVNGGCGD